MLLNNLRFAARLFLKDKFFSTLNVLGLALGITVSIILLLVVHYDLSYDQHYANHERIYRLGSQVTASGVDVRSARSSRPLAQVLTYELPEVEAVTRANPWGNTNQTLLTIESHGEEKVLYEPALVRSDSNYFKVFSHQFIKGNEKNCFKDLNAAVLTESAARRLFDDEDPIGKIITVGNRNDLIVTVTGVIKDLPGNTHLKFNILLAGMEQVNSYRPGVDSINSGSFWNAAVYMYVKMKENVRAEDFYKKWPKIYDTYYKSFGDKMDASYNPILQPLDEIHFKSDLDQDQPIGNIIYLYAFTGVGLFIVLLACINYMNLSTAKSAKRSTEIAMKKALGSGKSTLVLSILTESFLLSLLSLVIALAAVFIILRATSFNDLIGRELSFGFLLSPQLLLGIIGITFGVGLLSGLYPAFYLPAIPTITALKGGYKSSNASHLFRKILITAQFTISMFVVVCTLFIQDQIVFMRNQDMGFTKENVIVIPIRNKQDLVPSLKQELLQNHRILHASTSPTVLGMAYTLGDAIILAEGETGMEQKTFTYMESGEDYFKTLGIEIIKGRDFKYGPVGDVPNMLICNEAAAKMMGWGDNAVGKKVQFKGSDDPEGEIIGVVKDFNFSSLHNSIEPLVIAEVDGNYGFLHLRVASDHLPETLDFIKSKWATVVPGTLFEYFFLDQRFDEQYKADEVQYTMLTNLSYVCIFISLLGLLGLSAFTANQRTKEIGIRKILGANISRIIFMLSKDILLLVILSTMIVLPLSYWMVMKWLQNFAYRMPLDYLVYFIVMCVALIFVFLTITLQSYKTAQSNPVDALKYE